MTEIYITPATARQLSRYNAWQNRNVIAAVDPLGDAALRQDRGAFFGSILGTLNHLLWGDRIWMSRFAGLPGPNVRSIRESPRECGSWNAYTRAREEMDSAISDWAAGLSTEDLTHDLSWYSEAAAREITKPLSLLVLHLFNHQTHHRGQVHVMLTAAGAAPGDTDLFLMPHPSLR